jgi:hypothetical protein
MDNENKRNMEKIEKNMTKDKLRQVTKYIEKAKNINKAT